MKSGSAGKSELAQDKVRVSADDLIPTEFTGNSGGFDFLKKKSYGRSKTPNGKKTKGSGNSFAGKVFKKQDSLFVLSYRDMEKGVPASAISETFGKGLTRDDIRTVIPDRTLERRIAEGAPLKIEEADGIARLARVLDHALRAFGDERLADLWLRSPNPVLENRVPIHMARTDLGGREVEAVLYRIEYGVFS